MSYYKGMTTQISRYIFSIEKNLKLKIERNISFEEIITAINGDGLLDIVKHPNLETYSHQQMYVVYVNEYVYLVPFITNEGESIFLKTIIPSRKAKQKYSKVT